MMMCLGCDALNSCCSSMQYVKPEVKDHLVSAPSCATVHHSFDLNKFHRHTLLHTFEISQITVFEIETSQPYTRLAYTTQRAPVSCSTGGTLKEFFITYVGPEKHMTNIPAPYTPVNAKLVHLLQTASYSRLLDSRYTSRDSFRVACGRSHRTFAKCFRSSAASSSLPDPCDSALPSAQESRCMEGLVVCCKDTLSPAGVLQPPGFATELGNRVS